MMQRQTLFALILTTVTILSSQAFTPSSKCSNLSFLAKRNVFYTKSFRNDAAYMTQGGFEDFPPQEEDEYQGEVDWDAEWKKVVTNKNQPQQRPGEYKSDLEIAATKAKVAAEKKIISAKNEAKKMTDFNSLKGDWKVCLRCVLLSL